MTQGKVPHMRQHLAAQPVGSLAIRPPTPRDATLETVRPQVLEHPNPKPGGDRPSNDGYCHPPGHRRIQGGDGSPETSVAPLPLDRPPAPPLPPRDLLQHLLALGILPGVPDGTDASAVRPLPCSHSTAVPVAVDGADLPVWLGQAAVLGLACDGCALLER